METAILHIYPKTQYYGRSFSSLKKKKNRKKIPPPKFNNIKKYKFIDFLKSYWIE